MSDIEELKCEVAEFCRSRDWDQFHTNKELAAAIAIEAAELQDAFLWNREARPEKVREELADIFIYALRMAERNHLDVAGIVRAKLATNAKKYPTDKARGSAKKYTEL